MATAEATHLGLSPVQVDRPVMLQYWRDVTFVHWRFPAATVQRLLPAGLRVDLNDGSAWVGLVPFVLSVFTRTGVVGAQFAETNVRTYVRGPDGIPGIWFLSLDAVRTDAVLTARLTHGLPYWRARMSVQTTPTTVRYCSRRRWPQPPATSDITIAVQDPIASGQGDAHQRFLTERFCLYTTVGRQLQRVWAAHDPWPLHRARVDHLEQTMVAATGLPAPHGNPEVMYSPGVSVRISGREPVPRQPRLAAAKDPAADSRPRTPR